MTIEVTTSSPTVVETTTVAGPTVEVTPPADTPVVEIATAPPTAVEVNLTGPVQEVVVSAVGLQGPPGQDGADGAQGPPGAPGSAPQAEVWDQGVPATVWTITHALGYLPNVTVVDSAGSVVEGAIVYNSISQITVTFSVPFAGKAYLT